MKIYKYPKKEQWAEIVERPRLDLTKLNETVSTVLDQKRFWDIIGKLKVMGAQGILVTPLEKMILSALPHSSLPY